VPSDISAGSAIGRKEETLAAFAFLPWQPFAFVQPAVRLRYYVSANIFPFYEDIEQSTS
jgi:hypothetical protein